MIKKENYNFYDNIKLNSAGFSINRPILSDKINKTIKKFHVSNFNFILNDMKEENFKEKEEPKKNAYMNIPEKKENFIEFEADDDYLLSDNIENEYEFLGRKTKMKETIIEKDEIKESISKLKLLKIIEKYSYQNIFILLYKNFLSNKSGNDNYYNYNGAINQQILELIEELGLNKLLKMILSIGNERGEKIKLCFDCKEGDKTDSNNQDFQNNNKCLFNLAKSLEQDDIKEIINKNTIDNENYDKKNLKEKARSKLIGLLNEYTSRHNHE